MKIKILLLQALCTIGATAQEKNFLDVPYIEVTASADTLVVPDKLYLGITIREKDSKGKISVEEQETKMMAFLSSKGIDTKRQLSVADASSYYQRYFLKEKDILKTKQYQLIVPDAKTVAIVMEGLEGIGIANVSLQKAEYSGEEKLILLLKEKAVEKARQEGYALTKASGQKLGMPLFISAYRRDEYQDYYRGNSVGRFSVGVDAVAENFVPNDIDPRSIRFNAMANVKFKIL